MALVVSGGVPAAAAQPGSAPLPTVAYPTRDPDTGVASPPTQPPAVVVRPEWPPGEPLPPYYERYEGGIWGYRDRAGRFHSASEGFGRVERRSFGHDFDRSAPVSSGGGGMGRPAVASRPSGLPNPAGAAIVGGAPAGRLQFPHGAH